MKKRIMSLVLLLVVLLLPLLGLTSCGEDVTYLYLYNWGEYMPLGADDSVNVLKLFEDYYYETYKQRVKVIYSIFSSNEEMYAKLRNGSSKIDLIIPSDYMIERLIAEEKLQPLNFENIKNFGNISERFLCPEYDTDGFYSVPYTYGLVGLIYNANAELIQNDPNFADPDEISWRVLWDPRYDRQILTFNNSRDAFGIAQYILGYETGHDYVNTNDPARWNAALALLLEQKPRVQAYVMDEVFNKMESGAAVMAPYYAGDFYTMQDAQDEDVELALAYPKEGTNIFVDAFCIPKGSPPERKLVAERFIDFALSTDITVAGESYNVAREIAEYICYATPNDAVALDPEYEYFEDENLYPELDEDYPTYYFSNLPQETLEYSNELWEELKIGGGGDTGVYIATGVILLGLVSFLVFQYLRRRHRQKFY